MQNLILEINGVIIVKFLVLKTTVFSIAILCNSSSQNTLRHNVIINKNHGTFD